MARKSKVVFSFCELIEFGKNKLRGGDYMIDEETQDPVEEQPADAAPTEEATPAEPTPEAPDPEPAPEPEEAPAPPPADNPGGDTTDPGVVAGAR